MKVFNVLAGGKSASIVETTHAELVTLRDNAQLQPGQLYRITDYVATTTQNGTMSAEHSFDIIVLALNNNTLSEEASAIQHDGDEYFTNSNLAAWQLWYSLDNDKSRFTWADEENGKGVIYRMIDEFNNDVAYDFKNILFVRTAEWFSVNNTWYKKIFEENPIEDKWFYTFSWINENSECEDLSIKGNTLYNSDEQLSNVCYNKIKRCRNVENINLFALSNNVLVSSYFKAEGIFAGCSGNTFGYSCSNNTFSDSCSNITFGNNCSNNTFGYSCSNITFGNNCSNNTFGYSCSNITFGNDCSGNTFGYTCSRNTFGNNCSNNTFNYSCSDNTFGNNCSNNTLSNGCGKYRFGNSCSNNTFGSLSINNTFGNNCSENTFGNSSAGNTFGNNCSRNTTGIRFSGNSLIASCVDNTFGEDCQSITFDYVCSNNVLGSDCESISFEDHVQYINLGNNCKCFSFGKLCNNINIITSESNVCKNYKFAPNLYGEDEALEITLTPDLEYETYVAKDSSGNLKQGCLADLLS